MDQQPLETASERLQGLLEAAIAVGRELELERVLRRVVEVAVELVAARYGALGVVGEGGRLVEFIHVGMEPALSERIGQLPEGHGLLGQIVRDPQPLRLHDLSAHVASVGFPPQHPPMHSFLGVPVRVRGEVFGNLYLTEKNGGVDFTAEDESIVEALAVAAGVAIDHARLYAAAQQRERSMRNGAAVTNALMVGAVDEAARVVVETAAELLGVECASAWSSTEEGWALLASTGGADWGDLGSDVAAHLGFDSGRILGLEDHELLETAGLRAAALLGIGTGLGRLIVLAGNRSERGMLAELPEPLTSFAGQVAVALELAARRREAEDLAVLADRDRIARDLHDHVIQRIFAVGMSLESLAGLELPELAAGRVRRCVSDLDDTIRDIRTTIFELQSHDSESGFRARALALLRAAERSMSAHAQIHFEGTVDAAVTEVVADHALAMLREALSNVARHSGAARVDVLVRAANGHLLVQVGDDGVGRGDGRAGSGTVNMRSRADQLGGTFEVGSSPSGGTLVTWSVPLP